jgi:hypothetical protein
MSIALFFLYPLTFYVDQLYVNGFVFCLTVNMPRSNSWTNTEFTLFLFNVLKQSNIANHKSIANTICTKTKKHLKSANTVARVPLKLPL